MGDRLECLLGDAQDGAKLTAEEPEGCVVDDPENSADGRSRVAEGAPPTIYDIARATGMSPSTVSRALNKPGRMSQATEQRVKDAAASLGYRSNPIARALLTRRTLTLALVLSDITNPVYFELIRGAERAAAAAGYVLVLADTQESAERETDAVERLLPSVDGLVLVASRLGDEAIADLAARKSVVLVNRKAAAVPSVLPDPRPGVRAALTHLAELGTGSVAYLAGPPASYMSRLRWRVLQEEAARLSVSALEVPATTPTLDGGAAALDRVLATGATAVVAYNDLMAIGLLQACRERRLAVPGRLGVVGFDDIFGASFTTPSLTTIRSPLGQAGEYAVAHLVAGDVEHVVARRLATELVVRDSTGPLAID